MKFVPLKGKDTCKYQLVNDLGRLTACGKPALCLAVVYHGRTIGMCAEHAGYVVSEYPVDPKSMELVRNLITEKVTRNLVNSGEEKG